MAMEMSSGHAPLGPAPVRIACADGDAPTLSHPGMLRARLARIVGATVLALVGVSVPPATAASSRVFVDVESNCLGGREQAITTVRVTLRSAGGGFRTRVTTRSNRAGNWEACFDAGYRVRAGDRLVILAARRYRRVHVPHLSLKVDRVRGVISGRAPKNTVADLELCREEGLTGACDLVRWKERVDAQGRFTSSREVRGGDWVYLVARTPSGSLFRTAVRAPFMEVRLQSDVVAGHARPGSDVVIEVRRDGELVGRGTSVASRRDGAFTVLLARIGTQPPDLESGDMVSGSFASDASLDVPSIHVRGDASTDRVTGRCGPSVRGVEVILRRMEGSRDAEYSLTDMSLDRAGHFELIAWSGVRTRDRLYVRCQEATGDLVVRAGRVDP